MLTWLQLLSFISENRSAEKHVSPWRENSINADKNDEYLSKKPIWSVLDTFYICVSTHGVESQWAYSWQRFQKPNFFCDSRNLSYSTDILQHSPWRVWAAEQLVLITLPPWIEEQRWETAYVTAWSEMQFSAFTRHFHDDDLEAGFII